MAELDALARYLIHESRGCLRPPVDRFRHPWLAPMPLSPAAADYLRWREEQQGAAPAAFLSRPETGDGFKQGDYSLGLFHHDASEAAIELLRHPELTEAAAGSLLCLLDCAAPSGRVHRAELCGKSREAEPSKPVIAQYAARVLEALGPEWLVRHRVFPRVVRFIRFLEVGYAGLHGLTLTHSALASGFDSDILTAGLPDLSVEGPDTNSFLVLEYDALAKLARALGEPAAEWEEKAAALREQIERLLYWEDAKGAMYVGLRWQHGVGTLEGEIVGQRDLTGNVRPFETWITFLPLYAGVASPARAARLIQRMTAPGYWGPHGVRTVPKDDPYFHQAARVMLYDHKKQGRGPVSNWSGPYWVLSNYYLAEALARYGRRDAAQELALKTGRLLAADLARTGQLHESYDDEGNGLWPQGRSFLSWNVLALTLLRRYAPEAISA